MPKVFGSAVIKPNCPLLVRYCHITGGVLIRFQISRSTGVPVASSHCLRKKQKYDSVITWKENASKDCNCILSMFMTSFNIYFVFGYACFMCMCHKLRLLPDFFWDKVWLFLVKTGWQPWLQFGRNTGDAFKPYCRVPKLSLNKPLPLAKE